ncbi:MAG: response regulator transcription factor [Chitinophagaceae bacterium]
MEKNKVSSVIKVVVADDHEIFRDGFRVMLKKHPGIALVGEASNGQELIETVRRLQPDLVVTDIKMPVLDGIEATKQLINEYPGMGIIALSMFDEETLIMDMLEAGARGYLLKNAHKKEVFDAIESVHRGNNYYCNQTSAKLMNLLSKTTGSSNRSKQKKITFTRKELEIIELICKESSNKEIAEHINLTIRTVEKYRERIHEKTGAKNVVGVVVYAIKNGIHQL